MLPEERPWQVPHLAFLLLFIGLLMLVAGAEMLVRGGGQLALTFRVPALVVGLTIVAFGTSMPELVVCVTAAVTASTEMALANVNGSNIANIALVLGVAAMVRPLTVDRMLMRREVPCALGLQLMVPLFASNGMISRVEGVALLIAGAGYNIWVLYEALRGRPPKMDDDLEPADSPWVWQLFMLLAGLVVLVIGANVFVPAAEDIARAMNMSDRFIGLTVVALGTSAPELATGVVAAYRGEVDLAVGNSVGSNILNITMVLGATAVIAPISLQDGAAWNDMAAAVGATALLIPLVLKGSLNRIEGFLLTMAYLVYVAVNFVAA